MRLVRAFPALILPMLAVSGYASPIRMSYAPTTAPRPLLAARLPKLHLAAAECRTAGLASVDIREPAPEAVLSGALTQEFDRLGMPLASDPKTADAALRATWELASVKFKPLGCSVGIRLDLRTPSGERIWSSLVLGKGGSGGRGGVQDCMNEALASAMARIGPLFEEQGVIAKIFPEAPAAPVVRSDVDELPAVAAAPRDKAYAVVVGIRRYRQGLPEADFADADAGLLHSYLTRMLGYREANAVALINEAATKSAFEKYFESWLPNHVEPGDEVFVYFSGHGAPNPRTGDAFLVPYDGDPTYLDKTGYPLRRLYAELAKLPAGKVTVLLDSCFSGAGGRSVLAKGAKPLVTVSAGENIPEKLTVLSAAAGDQISYAYHEKGHGLFTYFFLKGLKERAGGAASALRAAFEYAAPQVANTARREYNAEQVPQWRGKR